MPISERGNRIELETQPEYAEVDEVSTIVEEQNSAIPSTTEENSTVSTGMYFVLQEVVLTYHQKIISSFQYF